MRRSAPSAHSWSAVRLHYPEVKAFRLCPHDLPVYQANHSLQLLGVIELFIPHQVGHQGIDDGFLRKSLLLQLYFSNAPP